MPDYFYQITDLNDNVKGEIRDKALTDLETAANAGKFIQISGNQMLTAADESVFIAIYGTTTAAEVQAAINAGKLVMAMKSDGQSIAPLCGIATTVYSFSYSAPNATANTGYPWFSMWTLNRNTNSWNTVHTTQVAKRENSDLTGTPTAPTAAVGTNTTQIATTAFVQTAINNADDAEILTYGDTSVTYADIATKVAAGKVLFAHYSDSSDNVTLPYVCTTTSGNHVFTNMVGNTRWTIYLSNTDTWSITSAALAPLASPSFTGNPTAPTQAAENNSTRIATTAFVKTAIDNAGAVLFSQAQSLTDAQKAQAYNNMMPDQLSAQGIKLPGSAVAGGTITKRGLTEGWYRLAIISSVPAKLIRVMFTSDYSSAIPTTFDLSLFANYNYSGNFQPEWTPHFVRGAGRSISKIRIGADGGSVGSAPQYLDVYVSRQLNSYILYCAIMVLGSDGLIMSDLTPVSTPPAIVNEYTLVDTGA